MKIKTTIYCILFCFSFLPSLFSQAEISTENCNSIAATINNYSKVSSSDYSFVLEKEILKDVWQKIASETKKSKTCIFKSLNSGTYRVSIIPYAKDINLKTKVHVFGSKKEALANLYVSNSLVIKTPCDEIQDETENENRVDEIVLFPNPAHSEISMFFPFKDIGTLKIYNTSSKLVLSTDLKPQNNTVDISKLRPGLYYAKVFHLENYLCVRKILVVK